MTLPASTSAMTPDLYLATIRELVRTYQAFSSYSEAFVRRYDLTPAQFDVLATLGHTHGMTMGEIGTKTLITKGTLTGVVDRLAKKGLVSREVPPKNRRHVIVKLTDEGEALFEQAFPAHLQDIQQHLESLDTSELELLQVLLKRLQKAF